METNDVSSVYNDDSMRQTYERHASGLLKHAQRLTGSAEQAKDIFHSTIEAAIKKLRGSEEKRAPFTMAHSERERAYWLYRVSFNKSMEYLREKYADDQHCVSSSTDPMIALTSYAPDLEDQMQFRDDIRIALAQLSPAAAEILIFRCVLGYTLDEIAAANGDKDREAPKKRLYRAKQSFIAVFQRPPSSETKGRNA